MLTGVRLNAAVAFVLVAAVFAVYFQVREHAFVNFDDAIYLLKIRTGLTFEGIRIAFTSSILSNWVPLTWITLLVDYDLYGHEPAGYHLTSVALHGVNAVLLYAAFVRMTGAVWRSACVAAVFAVHPLHVESVAWLSERKDVLSGLFWMLTLIAYARHVAGPRSRASYSLVLLCLALGLMAKPMLVTLPFVLLLLDYWPLGRLRAEGDGTLPDPERLRTAVVEKLPMFALVGAASAVAVATQRSARSVPGTELIPMAARVSNAFESYVAYVWTSLWPTGLTNFYPHPLEAAAPERIAACVLMLAAVTALALWSAGRRPYAAVGWLWFVGTLVPVIGLVQVGMQARADRYMYLPQIGLSVAIVWGAADLAGSRRSARLALSAAACAAIVAFGVAAWRQTSHWRDTVSLWERAIAVDPESFRARRGLADALRREGRNTKALDQYAEALRLRPGDVRARIGMAEALSGQGRFAEAIPHYERALAARPEKHRSRINLGRALLATGRVADARTQFEIVERAQASGRASLSRPFRFFLRVGMAAVLEEQGDPTGAIGQLQRALELRPNDTNANLRLGTIAARSGRYDLALRHLERAREGGAASPELDAAIAKLRAR